MTTSSRRLPLAAVILLLGATAGVRTQTPRPMGIVDLLNIPRLSDPQLSPDGKDVIYTRADADWKVGRRVSHIWRAPLDGGQPVQLTSGADGENDPRWSPDGKTIAFTAKRGDDEFAQIYLLPGDGGEARRLTAHASAVSELTWSPDGSSIFFKAAEAKSAEDKAREKARDDVYLYDENYKQTHVWNVAVASKAETPDHRRRFLRDGLRTVGRRPQDDLPSRANAAARRRRQERGLGGQRRRHQRRAGDAKRRAGDQSGHLARQRSGAVRLRIEREIRDLLQRPACSSLPPAAARRGRSSARPSPSMWTAPSGRRMASRSTSSRTSAFTKSSSSCRPPAASRGRSPTASTV